MEHTGQAYMSRAKPPCEATNYMLFYFALDENDAAGKEHVAAVLDRKTMWDCSAAVGSSTCYEFVGLPGSSLSMRYLPCPCQACCDDTLAEPCSNLCIVGEKTATAMSFIEYEDIDMLHMPLTTYTNAVLLRFLKKHKIKSPKQKTKDNII